MRKLTHSQQAGSGSGTAAPKSDAYRRRPRLAQQNRSRDTFVGTRRDMASFTALAESCGLTKETNTLSEILDGLASDGRRPDRSIDGENQGTPQRLYLLPAPGDDPDAPPPASSAALPHSRDAPG